MLSLYFDTYISIYIPNHAPSFLQACALSRNSSLTSRVLYIYSVQTQHIDMHAMTNDNEGKDRKLKSLVALFRSRISCLSRLFSTFSGFVSFVFYSLYLAFYVPCLYESEATIPAWQFISFVSLHSVWMAYYIGLVVFLVYILFTYTFYYVLIRSSFSLFLSRLRLNSFQRTQ